jgi:MinD-like ATPase involved in chromosome partitioning or flagellar assembly
VWGVLVAPGGVGKTRLAAELCARVERTGGVAGFLQAGADGSRVRELLGCAPVVVVIDDANTRSDEVKDAISAVSDSAEAVPPSRVCMHNVRASAGFVVTEDD